MDDFKQIIFNIADLYKNKYRDVCHAEAGCNGPYRMEQLPIRNTAYWIITFSIMYQFTNNMEYKNIARQFTEYLVSEIKKDNFAVQYLVKERNIIGLAWTIEALLYAFDLLGDMNLLKIAQQVFLSQKYNEKLHIWSIVDQNKKDFGICIAFNQNLWFATAGAKLCKKMACESIEFQVNDFIMHINDHLRIYNNGLIGHYVKRSGNCLKDIKHSIRHMIFQITKKDFQWKNRNWLEYEKAYHLYNMYAFARLKQLYPDLYFFKTKKMSKILSYTFNIDNFIEFKGVERFSYAYNSPAYEYPIIQYVFEKSSNHVTDRLYKLHCDIVYDSKKKFFSKNTDDVPTLNARIYEIMQFYELEKGL